MVMAEGTNTAVVSGAESATRQKRHKKTVIIFLLQPSQFFHLKKDCFWQSGENNSCGTLKNFRKEFFAGSKMKAKGNTGTKIQPILVCFFTTHSFEWFGIS